MIKITSEISEIENRRIMKKILKTPNLVYWKHQQNFKNLARLMQKKKGEDSEYWTQEWKRWCYNQSYRNKKDYKRIPWTIVNKWDNLD